MLELNTTAQFRRDYKLIKRRGYNIALLEEVLDKLLRRENLDARHRDHALTGDYAGFRECHVRADWLLVYAVDDKQLTLTASRTGTHSEIFGI